MHTECVRICLISYFAEISQPVGLQYNLYVNPSVRPLQVSENVHNSWTAWCIFITFCVHLHVNIPYPLVYTIFGRYGFAACCGQLVKILNSWTLVDIWVKFCTLIYFDIVQPPWYSKRLRWFTEYHFDRSRSFSEIAHNFWDAWYIVIKLCI